MQPTQSPLVWFVLVDSVTGNPYKATSVSSILRSSIAVPVVDQFRDAVKAKNADSHLKGVAASDLIIYKNKTAFDKRNATDNEGKEEPLDPTESLDQLGSKEDKLVVVVPLSGSSSQSSSDSNLTVKKPNPKRKQRWIELNQILSGYAKKSKTFDSTAYSYVTWK
jgi:hypothetical protein